MVKLTDACVPLTALMAALLWPCGALAQGFDLPEPAPAAIDFDDVELDPEDRRRYLDEWRDPSPPDESLVLRVSAGGAVQLDGDDAVGAAFAFQIESGARSTYRSGLRYELGYGYAGSFGAHTAHVVLIGGGVGGAMPALAVSYLFHAAFGVIDDRAAAGIRHGVLLLFGETVGVRVQHQMLDAEGDALLYHGLSVAITVDLIAAMGGLSL